MSLIINEENINWANIFRQLAKLEEELQNDVSNISVNETSLEDIFLKISKTSGRSWI